jgi:TolB-like protein
MSLIENLKQRKLVEWALAYLAGAWLVVQGMEALSEPLGLTLGVQRGLLMILVAGLPITLTLAWYHGEQGRQRVGGMELLILAVLLAGTGLLVGRVAPGSDTVGDSDTAVLPPEFGDGLPRLAVLPFVNRSALPEDENFTDGIHDQVLTELSKRGDVRLLSRTSVQEYRDSEKSIREIASELQATHLVEGAVQRAGDSVLVTAQLIDATDQHLWSNDYQRELTVAGLFGIQREVAQRVARELGLQLTPADDQGESLPTQSSEAWEAYQQARLLDLVDARRIALAEEAVRLDSTFVEGWALLAAAHAARASDARRFESRAPAREALRRARELNPDHVSVLQAEVMVEYGVEFDFRRALEVADEVLQRRSNSPGVLYAKARIHERLGEWDEAFAGFERGLEHDPRSFRLLAAAWHLASGVRRFNLARRYLERAGYTVLSEEDREHVQTDAGLLHVLERVDTTAYRQERQTHGLEIEPPVCREIEVLSFPYLRRQFDRALELCRANEGTGVGAAVVRYFRAGRLAEWIGEPGLMEVYADSLRERVEDYHAALDSVEYGEFRWPRAWAYAQEARWRALAGDSAAATQTARRALEIFTPKNDVRDTGRVAGLLIEPYLMVGDHATAMDMMEIAGRAGTVLYASFVRLDPVYDPLREEPRFQEILRTLEEPR